MAKTGLILLLFLAAIALRAEEAGPFPLTAPEALFVSVGDGLQGASHTAIFDGRGLAYFHFGGKSAEKIILHPKPEAWRKFMARMNELKVYRWAADASSKSSASKGTPWILLLKSGGQTLKSKGNGGFTSEFSPQIFAQFCRAVSDLLGKPFPASAPVDRRLVD